MRLCSQEQADVFFSLVGKIMPCSVAKESRRKEQQEYGPSSPSFLNSAEELEEGGWVPTTPSKVEEEEGCGALGYFHK